MRKVWLVVALGAVAAAAAFAVPPFTRPPAYYDFADRRDMLGVPNFMDVMSNLPWLVLGLLGLAFVAKTPAGRPDSPFADRFERLQFALFCAGILSIAVGSAYFHLHPAPATLLWDRLPMSVTFMALFGIVIGERINRRAGRVLFLPLVAIGIASVWYWHATESIGRGDERPYVLVQFFPMLALPIILWLFPVPFARTGDLMIAIAWYGVAKLFELADRLVFTQTAGAISGHTLKHLAAALTTVWLLRMMRRRRPLAREWPVPVS